MPDIYDAHQPEEAAGSAGWSEVAPPEARREIEAVLSTFRQWLLESEQWRRMARAGGGGVDEKESPVSLHEMLSEWIALRQELRLEAKGSKGAREELDRAVQEFQGGIGQVERVMQKALEPVLRDRDRLRDEAAARLESQERGWLELMLDVREALVRAAGALRQSNARLGWRRWFMPRDLVGGLLEGYELGLQRIDAALESRDICRIDCVGGRVDPERMRVVEVVERPGLPEGQVVDVVREGFVSGSRVVRYAEVRAAAGMTRKTQNHKEDKDINDEHGTDHRN